MSAISRCPSSKLIDGLSKPVQNSIVDRLCLDGQRLIRSSDAGVPLTDPGLPDMVPDAEFRLESDNSVRFERTTRPAVLSEVSTTAQIMAPATSGSGMK